MNIDITEGPIAIHRYEMVPIEMVAMRKNERCDINDRCTLADGHNSACAVTSLVGLVHEVLDPPEPISREEKKALQQLTSAQSAVDDAIEELYCLVSDLKRSGPKRVRDALEDEYSTGRMFDWFTPGDEDDWDSWLEGTY